jgi:hypothetical protein
MKPLSREERLFVLELVTDIASEAAQNPNVVWMIEFQEELVEKLYRKMVALLEEPRTEVGATSANDAERGDDAESGAGRGADHKSDAQRPRKVVKRGKPAKKPR